MEKVSFHSNPKKGNSKECSNYRIFPFILHVSKVMLKILQARLQQYVNCELPEVQAGFRKGKEPEIKLPTSSGSLKKQESSRKTSISALLTTSKPLTVWITTNWKILKEMGIPDQFTCLLRNLYAGQEATVRTGHGKNWLIWKDPNAGKDWRQEEKGMTEDEMIGWHHLVNGHKFE